MKIVIIGSSTGGPYILESIFKHFPVTSMAIIIVQHLPPTFTTVLKAHIASLTHMPVKIVNDEDIVTEPHIYIAPAGKHVVLHHNRVFFLRDGEKVHGVRPAVDMTMLSIQKRSEDTLMGIILTGMGRDGADGIFYLHKLGAITIAQDPKTAPIKSMPQAAIETGEVDYILTPDEIRQAMISFSASFK